MSQNENETSKKKTNAVQPGEGSNDGNLDGPGIDLHETDIDNQNENQNAPLKEEDQAEDSEEETDTREKLIRVALDNFMNGETYGVQIERFIGLISVVSCCAFIILTYTDWSRDAECCIPFYHELDKFNEDFA